MAQYPVLSMASELVTERNMFPPEPLVGGFVAVGDTLAVGSDSTSVQALSKVVAEPRRTTPTVNLSTPPARRTTRRAAPPPDPRVEIERVVQRLARAMESRSVDNLRQVHTTLSEEDEGSWAAFFDAVQTLEVTLTVNRVQVSGNSASASLGAVYRYPRSDGGVGEQSAGLLITLARGSAGWRLTSIKNQ
jgi:hypothetical protein